MFLAVIVVLLIGVVAVFVLARRVVGATEMRDPISIELKEGEGVRTLADRLVDAGVIRDAALFRRYVQLKGIDRSVQAGVFTFTPPHSIARIADQLAHPEQNERSITVLPGWDLREIATYLSEQGFGSEEDFFAFAGKSAALYAAPTKHVTGTEQLALFERIPKTASLEGYLAPDTFRVYNNATIADIIAKMAAERDSQFTEQMYKDIAAQKRTVHDIVIMASLLEREVRSDADRKKVADLFWRRYDMGWALQADSTVHYAVNKKGNVYTTKQDRETNSPWNTYKYPGLPIGPISTPSLSSIMAAIYPEKNDYWFFLTTPEGKVVYGKTLEEHNANKVHLR